MDQEVRNIVSNALEKLVDSMPNVVTKVIEDGIFIALIQEVTNDMLINSIYQPSLEEYIVIDFEKKLMHNKDIYYQHCQKLYYLFTRQNIKWYEC